MPESDGSVLAALNLMNRYAHETGRPLIAVVEDQCGFAGAKGRVSAAAMFNFGRGFGFLLGVLQTMGCRVILVRPQKWQSALCLGTKAQAGGRTAWKNVLKVRASQLNPNLKVTLSTADALLLLEYALCGRIADSLPSVTNGSNATHA